MAQKFTEQELVSRAQGGDETAWTSLIDRHDDVVREFLALKFAGALDPLMKRVWSLAREQIGTAKAGVAFRVWLIATVAYQVILQELNLPLGTIQTLPYDELLSLTVGVHCGSTRPDSVTTPKRQAVREHLQHLSDDQLLLEVQLGDRTDVRDVCWMILTARHHASLLGYLARCQNKEDIAQRAWLKAHMNPASIQAGRGLQSWLRRVAYTTMVDECRHGYNRREVPDQLEVESRLEYTGASEGTHGDAERHLDVTREMTLFKEVQVKALAELPEEDQELLIMRFHEETELDEMASRRGVAKETLKMPIQRAAEKWVAKILEIVDADVALCVVGAEGLKGRIKEFQARRTGRNQQLAETRRANKLAKRATTSAAGRDSSQAKAA